MTNILDNELVRKIEAIYQILIEKHSCIWGHGIQHALCDPSCHCLCKTDQVQKKECIVCDGTVGRDAQLCDEHGRIWLGRKSAPEKAFIETKPSSAAEKCDCNRLDCKGRPSSAVEEKIDAFCNVWVPRGTHDKAKVSLRELVRLAREGQ